MNSFGGSVSRQHEELLETNRRLRAEAECLCAEIKQKIEHMEWLVDSISHRWRPDFFRPLHDAIRAMHGCESRHAASFAVRKVRDDRVLWSGIVDEFELDDATGAGVCYAWQYKEDGRVRTFILLKQPPVDSPQDAVQFFLLAKRGPSVANVLA